MRFSIHSLTNKFLIVMAAALIIVVGTIMVYEWQATKESIEDRLLTKGKGLALSLSHTLQNVSEQDMKTGIVLQDGTKWEGKALAKDLFNSELTVNAESQQSMEKRSEDSAYASKQVSLYNGNSIPMSQYELKYDSEYDKYTDERWQGIIDSFITDADVIYAFATAYSDNPDFVGYISTHNSIFSPTGEESVDAWGFKGLQSQNNRANRIFNESTGYNAAMNSNTEDVLLQKYDRLINGETVETWDISFPLMIDGKHWGAVRIGLSKQSADAQMAAERTESMLEFGGLMIIVLVLLYILAQFMVGRKLREIVHAAVNLNSSEADLTYRIAIKGRDDISLLGQEINRFIAHMQILMEGIRSNATAVTEHASKLSDGSTKSRARSSQLALTVNEMATGAENQADGALEVARSMEEMAESVSRIAHSSNLMAEASGGMLTVAEHGNEKSGLAVNQMERLGIATSMIATTIGELNERSAEIQEMADTITAIAAQTNLLALNAAIEAARAGEHGRGFAVVSGEVRKLAEQASLHAGHIKETINGVLALTTDAVNAVHSGEIEMEQSKRIVGELKTAFDTIVNETREVAAQIQDVSASTEEMAAGSEQVSASVDAMAQVAKTTSHLTTQSAADTAILDELASDTLTLSTSVNELANELQKSISRFKLE